MIGDTGRPLSVKALNAFFVTLETELEHTNLDGITRHIVLGDLLEMAFPVERLGRGSFQFCAARRLSTKLPESTEELRALGPKLANAQLKNEMSEEIAKLQIQQACEKAVRAAEKVMLTESARSR